MALQDRFWQVVQHERIPVTIDLLTGCQLQGTVRSWDGAALLLENEGRQQLVYAQAVASVSPMRRVSLPDTDEGAL